MPRPSQPVTTGRRLTEDDLVRLISGEFVYRRCPVCEWEGLIAQAPKTEPDCPMCHAPTELIAFLQPMTSTVPIWKNPHASALGRLGGRRGGPARAAALSPKRRTEIARNAALARWKRKSG
jgi:ribosomal protein S27E